MRHLAHPVLQLGAIRPRHRFGGIRAREYDATRGGGERDGQGGRGPTPAADGRAGHIDWLFFRVVAADRRGATKGGFRTETVAGNRLGLQPRVVREPVRERNMIADIASDGPRRIFYEYSRTGGGRYLGSGLLGAEHESLETKSNH